MAGIRAAEATTFDAAAIRRHTEQFSRQRFTVQIAEFVDAAVAQSRGPAVARRASVLPSPIGGEG